MQDFEKERKALIEEIKLKGIKDKRVLDAIWHIPRHLFVRPEHLSEAYYDHPLHIGKGQTISQPYTVAFMLEALQLKKGFKVLEIGTGSGWNAALISWLIGKKGKIITTEIYDELISFARENINKVGLKNIKIIKTDGSLGWQEEAPYDRIIATCALPKLPEPWLKQLKNNGIIIAPIGTLYEQEMTRIIKKGKNIKEEILGSFMFVPLKGKYGF